MRVETSVMRSIEVLKQAINAKEWYFKMHSKSDFWLPMGMSVLRPTSKINLCAHGYTAMCMCVCVWILLFACFTYFIYMIVPLFAVNSCHICTTPNNLSNLLFPSSLSCWLLFGLFCYCLFGVVFCLHRRFFLLILFLVGWRIFRFWLFSFI